MLITTILCLLALGVLSMLCKEIYDHHKKELPYDDFDKKYISALVGIIALLLVCPIWNYYGSLRLDWRAQELSEQSKASVNCDVLGMGQYIRYAGFVYRGSKEINLKYPYCSMMKKFLRNPDMYLNEIRLGKEFFSLHVFTHEAMHVRGEFNEQKAECQAVQRNYRAGKIHGLSDEQAKKFAIRFYLEAYPRQAYFSEKCHPGGEYDEKRIDSTWNLLEKTVEDTVD